MNSYSLSRLSGIPPPAS